MKSIYNKVYVHPFFYLIFLLSFLTGLFKEFIIFTSIIIIHEIGHITMAILYKWNIQKIVILPFGGITIFNELINKSMFEEFIILIMGPLFQLAFYFVLIIFNNNYLLTNYHWTILIFNLIPIYPLDGSKILKIIFEYFFSFKLSHLLIITISIINIILLLYVISIYKLNFMLLLIVIFLIIGIIKEIKNHKSLFNKFILELYLYKFNFKRTNLIFNNNLKKLKRCSKNIFFINNQFFNETNVINDIIEIKKLNFKIF